jgi:biotin carboxyl carrier protein
MALDRSSRCRGPVAEVSQPEGQGVRVSLGTSSARPEIPGVIVEPDAPSDDQNARVRVQVDGEVTAGYGVARADADRLVIVDNADPSARIVVVVAPSTGSARGGSGPRRGGMERLEVLVGGWRFDVEVEPAARALLREQARRGRSEAGRDGPVEVRAIIPGVVVSVSVATGDQVAAGQQLLVVEAMKMQNELRSPRDGVVERVTIGERQTIEVGDLLVVIE